MQSEPPPGSPRLPIFYLGTAVSVIGVLLFLSVFVTFLANFGNFDHFDERARSSGFRALGGMVLMVVGGVIASAAGGKRVSSRLLRNVQQLRDQVQLNSPARELPPVRCAYCSVENDAALSNCAACGAPLSKKRRCAGCGTVNEPDAKFCNQCGVAV
jgi:hypothetical protein